MQFKAVFIQTILATLFSSAAADCQLGNEIISTEKFSEHEDSELLCLSQGEGQWTFAMELSEILLNENNDCLNTLLSTSHNPFAGFRGNADFAIYDNTCALKGAYYPGQNDNDCGTPYFIMENFLAQVLTITNVRLDTAKGYFSFAYGDGLYSINNNHCDCVEKPDGLEARAFCKCASPIDGHFVEKRGVVLL
ncbi:hypothetical protein BU23DRAFT_532935 [Bimuria novae-zelandiae CBS 107.79]|uniref:Cyanovirin-N domain-containing protein n=1 Tax=Bimuria novae-zelandiae CBS 107.79 TaxID=1447943 RepID=A0A6A5V8J9_9PLEO|nr:hypothetical protein BU23DRAFT_532935 [Bimuria novae-zelandiae CBS 107.79]